MKTSSPNPAPCTRRDFVGLMALAGAAAPFSGFAPHADAAQSGGAAAPLPANSGPTCIHVYAKFTQSFSYTESAEILAESGYGGIDYAVRTGGHVSPERVEDDLPRAVEAARQAGLKVEMIVTGITSADKQAEALVRTAAKLGVKHYRFGVITYDEKRSGWDSLQQLKPVVKDLVALNRAHGIQGVFQNQTGPRMGAALWDMFELLREHDPRWIGNQYDIRHATVEGGQSWPVALRLLSPWIRCSNLKDFKWRQVVGKETAEIVPLGEGVVNFAEYFKLVRELKLGGPISMHLEYPPFEGVRPPLSNAEKRRQLPAALRKDLKVLKEMMARYQIA
ncbi:MAG: sugar phosphate isomerase/epimerase [Opitutus sp.]|nr:sugar phosphate isomerase/epimerase [Opitutus sp.]